MSTATIIVKKPLTVKKKNFFESVIFKGFSIYLNPEQEPVSPKKHMLVVKFFLSLYIVFLHKITKNL